ncbi:MAG: endonuclease/exonuclease/phosphatase family protein [Rhizobiaceae bacterium]|nr:endonuclease/exonuclease/phosphatase family protein [Rhizobiaceae bacterium]
MLLALEVLTGLLLLATVLPHAPVAHGVVRIGDFPRQQIAVLALLLLAASLLVDAEPARTVVQIALAAIAVVQAAFILPFTPLWRRQTADFDADRDARGAPVRLIACNVKQSNDDHARLADILVSRNPDIVILMEVNQAWLDALDDVLAAYAHVIRRPQENSYGMVLASRFELRDAEVGGLLTEGVPSIRATVSLTDALSFRLYAIHPEPPVPNHGSEGRDGETGLVALRVRDEELPVLVTGDLNDVAWSGTTQRFRRVSRLLDPRIGRKVFSTFDARFPLMRWPLDHLFHSPEFRLREMERLPACGSDHFPVMFDMVLCPSEKAESKPQKANGADIARARNLAGQAQERQEKPIGSDWEG